MKKFYLLAIVVFLVVLSACATPAKQFEADKDRIHVVDGADSLNITFRDAVEANPDFDEVIKDSYVAIGYFRGRSYCTYSILTEDGEYLTFDVDDAERLFLMYGPVPPQDKLGGPLGRYELVDWDGHTGTIRRHKNK